MADEQLQRRVEELRRDYAVEWGAPFNHFCCPILRTDEPVDLCKGHVINKAFGNCNVWVPQRADIDNFYGSIAEAAFVDVVQGRGKTPLEKWLDPTLRKRHRPRLEFEGVELEHYFSNTPRQVAGQTPVQIVGASGAVVSNFVVKESPDTLMRLHGKDIQVVIERDYGPAVIASILKAAHLTLFHLLGYRYVFAPDGMFLSHILGEFFLAHRGTPRNQLDDATAKHFRQWSRMISPMIIQNASLLRGTVVDRRLLACVGGSEGIFAIGAIIQAGDDDAFCVFLPSGIGKTIDTYFGFLKDPPQSIAVKLIEFCPAEGEQESHWKTGSDEPFRIPLQCPADDK